MPIPTSPTSWLPAFHSDRNRPARPAEPVAGTDHDLARWDDLPGSGHLQEWARDLRDACAAPGADPERWALIGRAVVLVGPDLLACTRALRRVAADAGYAFVELFENGECDIAPMAALHRAAPVLVYLEADPCLVDPENVKDEERREFLVDLHGRLAAWMQAFDPAHPVVLATVTREVADTPSSLRGVGLFDRFFRVPAATMQAYGREFVHRMGGELCAASITGALHKTGLLFSTGFDTERRKSLAVLRLRRLATREQRPLELADLVNLSLHGFAEEDNRPTVSADTRRQIAYHEAGHAAVAILDSGGQNIPEHATIIPAASTDGVVVTSLEYLLAHETRETYAEMRHDVRVSLAGRAAEELIVGAVNVSNGAISDLRNAVLHSSASFAYWGFAPDMEKPRCAGSNLLIIGIDDDPFSASEAAHLEGLVRRFLSTEYEVVKDMLTAHRPLLDAIADRLMQDAVLDHATLAGIARHHVPELAVAAA
jgi:hypothetical protein